MKTVGIIVAIFVGIIATSIAVKVIFFPVHTAQKEIQTAYNVMDKTLNADNAIYNYEWFKQTKEDIEALKNKYDNAVKTEEEFKKSAGDRKKWRLYAS